MRSLIVFTKHPLPGQSKTRLAADIGWDAAFRVNEALLDHAVEVARNTDAVVRVYYGNEIPASDRWSEAGFERYPQSGPDLGARMAHAFEETFRQGFSKVLIIGTDCYDLHNGILEAAFAALDHAPVVIGPALDGGYYLLGLRQPAPELFSGIDWSTDRVYTQTLSAIQGLGLTWRQVPALRDVDHATDLKGTLLEQLTK